MALSGSKLLSCLKKRDLLNDPQASPEVVTQEGKKFWEAGYVQDALECFVKAEFQEGLEWVLEWALQEGDFFVAQAASAALKRELSPSQWEALGEKAREKGKYRFSLNAFTKAGSQEKAEEIRQKIQEDWPAR